MINQDTIESFHREGVAVLRGLIDAGWLDKLACAVETNMREPGPHGKNHTAQGEPGGYFGDYVNWPRIGTFRDICEHGPLGAAAGALMGSNRVQLFHEHVLVKEPGTAEPTPWHQDMPYYCMTGGQTVSLWVPLDPVDKSVCPQFLAGSHRDKITYTPRRFKTLKPLEGDMSSYRPFPGVDEVGDAQALRAWRLAPGDAIAFDYHTLHNAPPNPSSTRRRAVSFRFFGEDARYVARAHEVSPPFPEMGLALKMGDEMPADWFPVVWDSQAARRRLET